MCGVYIALQCNNVSQVKLSDASTLQVKHEPGTPTYDEDSMSSMDAQPVKVCIAAMCQSSCVPVNYCWFIFKQSGLQLKT